MKILFWGNTRGQAGTSANMIAVAMMNDLLYQKKSILLQTHFDLNQLETWLLERKKRELVCDYRVGIDQLIQGILSGMNTRQLLMDCCLSVTEECIDFLPGTQAKHREVYEQGLQEAYHTILNLAQQCYEDVFIDACTGMNPFMKKLWDEADYVVVCLSQNIRVLNDFFRNYTYDRKKTLFLIGNYDKRSELNLKNLFKRYKSLNYQNTMVIPYNVEFRDAMAFAKIKEFFYQNIHCDKEDSNFEFIEQVKGFASLLYRLSEEKQLKIPDDYHYLTALGGASSVL